MIEGGTPNTLLRRGINKNSLPAGTLIVVDGYQAKNGTNRANGRDISIPDGKKLFWGSSGPALPRTGVTCRRSRPDPFYFSSGRLPSDRGCGSDCRNA